MIPKIHRLSNLVCLNILLLMIIVACSTKPQPGTPTQIAAVDVTNCELANVAGEVEIFPAQSSSSKIASDTTAVQCGDEILLKSGSSAELYCGNLDPQYLVAGITFTVNCTSGKIPTMPCYADQGCRGFATGHGVGSPEREGTIQIPYVIEPRATLLLEQPKILRWNPVDGASEYEVTVRGRDLRWVTTTTESEVV